MIIRTRPRRIAFLLAFHTLAWGAAGFFLYSAQTGDRGLAAKREAKARIAAIGQNISEQKAERAAWERRVTQLSGTTVDRDLLDERQRLMLGTAHRNDVVILLDR
jgi:cell division protein FtsB